MGIRIYLLFIIVSDFFCAISGIITGTYKTDSAVISLIVTLLSYLFVYKIYQYMDESASKESSIHFSVSNRRLDIFMTIFLVAVTVFSLRTGDGAAETGSLNSSSSIASLFQADAIFPFYYWINRGKSGKFVLFNSLFYLIYKLLLGWSGIIFILFFFELYYQLEKRKKNYNMFKVGGIIAGSFIGGSFVYSFLYPLKYSIRLGMPYQSLMRLPFFEALSKLTQRVSAMDTTVYVHDNISKIANMYLSQNKNLIEFKAAFRPLIPRAIFSDKIFSSIGSMIHNAKSGYYTGINITGNCAILEYYRLMLYCDFLDLLLCLILTIIVLYAVICMCRWFREYGGQYKMLLFWIMLNGYVRCGTIENSLIGRYLKMIFFLPLLFLLGIIKVKYYPSKATSTFNIRFEGYYK